MSQNDGFASGFIAGALVGSVLGGVIGALVATKSSKENSYQEDRDLDDPKGNQENQTQSIEAARHSLEGKIAELNLAIDDVRQQLGAVNGKSKTRLSSQKPELEED